MSKQKGQTMNPNSLANLRPFVKGEQRTKELAAKGRPLALAQRKKNFSLKQIYKQVGSMPADKNSKVYEYLISKGVPPDEITEDMIAAVALLAKRKKGDAYAHSVWAKIVGEEVDRVEVVGALNQPPLAVFFSNNKEDDEP